MDEAFQKIKSDIDEHKNQIAPLLSFIQEVKDLRRSLHISPENSVSFITLLSTHIKEDILKDVNSLNLITEDKMEELALRMEANKKETNAKLDSSKKQTETIEFGIRTLEELIVRQNSIIDIQRREVETLKKDMTNRVEFSEFFKLQKSLKHYTPLYDFQMLKSQLENYAEKTQIELLKKHLKKHSSKLKQCLFKTEFTEIFKKMSDETLEKFKEIFVKKSRLQMEIQELNKKLSKTDEDFKSISKRVELIHDWFKKKITEIFEAFNSKPWEHEIEKIMPRIEDSATKGQLAKVDENHNLKSAKLQTTITQILAQNETFERVLERYDEIFLEKASKDDIAFIQKKLEKYLLVENYKSFTEISDSKLSALSSLVNKLQSTQESMGSLLSNVSNRVETIKKENYEVSNISHALQSIDEVLNSKADKSDIFIIYDVMGKKEEMLKISEIAEISRKQMLTAVGVLQTLSRTLLNKGENPGVVKKLRLDVYKTLDGLQRWIKEGNGEPSCFLAVGRSNNNLKSDHFEENCISHFGTAMFSRRLRQGSVGTSPRYVKDEFLSLL